MDSFDLLQIEDLNYEEISEELLNEIYNEN